MAEGDDAAAAGGWRRNKWQRWSGAALKTMRRWEVAAAGG